MGIPEEAWAIPKPHSICEAVMEDGALVPLRRHGNPDGPRLVLCHGNGLASDLYYPFWSLLTDNFDLIVFDIRNHGWNPLSDIKYHKVPVFIRDQDRVLSEIDRHYGQKPKVGVFHSISALISLLSPSQGENFSALILFDPPICRPGRSYADFENAAQEMAEMTRIRTRNFANREQFADLLEYSPNFQNVLPGVHKLMSETTLRKSNSEHGGYEPCCPPEYEAQVVEYAGNYAVLVDVSEIRCPIKVIGADPTLPYSYLPTLDLTNVITANYDFLPDSTHMLQLEQPQKCVEAMIEFLTSHQLLDP